MQFRAGVVAVVTDSAWQVMAFERSDIPGAWQLPQGGINVGEDVGVAAWRELFEETGLGPDQVRLIDEYPEWTVYEWPAEVRGGTGIGSSACGHRLGQAQRWFFFRVLRRLGRAGAGRRRVRDLALGRSRTWLIEQVVEFRRSSYRRVLGN